jgi:hypothetical protein
VGGEPGSGGASWFLPAGEEDGLREFFTAVEQADPPQTVAWALGRFEMGSARGHDAEALSDYLLALRALLDATSDAGEASLALRVAALCAEEGRRKGVQRRMEAAIALERFVMGGGPRIRDEADSPRELVAEVEGHVRALLRDVLCGYLDADLKGMADDILLEATGEPMAEIKARDLRHEAGAVEPATEAEPEWAEGEQDTSELEPVGWEPSLEARETPPRFAKAEAVQMEPGPTEHAQTELEGVTASADWGWGEPEDYSAPV